MNVNLNNYQDVQSVELTVIQLDGRVMLTQRSADINNTLDISTLPTGAYVLRIVVDGQVSTQRFVK